MPTVTKQRVKGPTTNGKPASVLDRIKPIGFDDDSGIKVLVYGKSGSGKTSLWGTFPKPILSLVCSGGRKPGELRSIDTPENRKVISQVVLTNSREMGEVTDQLKANEDSGSPSYATVVLDHVTGFQDQVLAEIIGLEAPPVQKTWGLASQQDYGQCTVQCKELLRNFLSLNCNVVIVGQERTFDADGGTDLINPSVGAGLTPSLAGWVNTAVDYIVQTYLRPKTEEKVVVIDGRKTKKTVKGRGVEYCLRTGPDPLFTTKFRLPKGTPLPDSIVDPDYDKIYALIKGDVP